MSVFSHKIRLGFSGLMIIFLLLPFLSKAFEGNDDDLKKQALNAAKKATEYMVVEVSTNGGYLWNYLPDLSRRWGEMEAYKTMIWVQSPGTVAMGNLFLDAYHVTGDPYYWKAAKDVADALIWGQLECGGWNYMIDFAGDRSLKKWYKTIGKRGWRLEEFQHYYGNATFDDQSTIDAARFMLRMYLESYEAAYKRSLDKAIGFVLKSQYPIGGWPQRYPLYADPLYYDYTSDFTHKYADYTSYYTFNDGVTYENLSFLIDCYRVLGQKRLLNPIRRAMNFFLITQHGSPQAGWGKQYNHELETAGARTYEPKSLNPSLTALHINHLMDFYRMTGRKKFLRPIEPALEWLENSKLPVSMRENGKYTHPQNVELGTNKPLFVHRQGSNVLNGKYYADYNPKDLIGHYGQRVDIDISELRERYERIKDIPEDTLIKDSPLIPKGAHQTIPQEQYLRSLSQINNEVPEEESLQTVISRLDEKGRWLVTNSMTSNPYIEVCKSEDDIQQNKKTHRYATTYVGDSLDTSPYRDTSDQKYISTRSYIKNMRILLNYIENSN